MGELVNGDPVRLELGYRGLRGRDQQHRHPATTAHHPEGDRAIDVFCGRDDEVDPIDGEARSDRGHRSDRARKPAPNVVTAGPWPDPGNRNEGLPDAETILIEPPESGVGRAIERVEAWMVAVVVLGPRSRDHRTLGEGERDRNLEAVHERLGTPQPFALRDDHRLRVASSKDFVPEACLVEDTAVPAEHAQLDLARAHGEHAVGGPGAHEAACRALIHRGKPLQWETRETGPHSGTLQVVKDCNLVSRNRPRRRRRGCRCRERASDECGA